MIRDHWDDWFEYATSYSLVVVDAAGGRYNAGKLKIGEVGLQPANELTPGLTQGQRRPTIPSEFETLGVEHFSLGQDQNYYETLHRMSQPLRSRITGGLHDVAANLALLEQVKNERVMLRSLLRSVDIETIVNKFHPILHGNAALTPYSFSYILPREIEGVPVVELDFYVEPHSHPPTNIHVIIGRNGVGKTRCLNAMAHAIITANIDSMPAAARWGVFNVARGSARRQLFTSLVSVSFSAFDPFGPIDSQMRSEARVKYQYVGLKKEGGIDAVKKSVVLGVGSREGAPIDPEKPVGSSNQGQPSKNSEDLVTDFVESFHACRENVRSDRWLKALSILQTDPLFADANIVSMASGDAGEMEDKARKTFDRLSSGHKIVLLTVSRLVEMVDERSLVLLDEPEAHLHPPLLSSFVRCLSELLIQRNGVAIVATHSPVILQEVPKSCVWIIRRSGHVVAGDRSRVETFGESIGILTREVFGLEVTRSGFHSVLQRAVEQSGATFESIYAKFEGQLGAEARVLLRSMLLEKSKVAEKESVGNGKD